MSRLRTILGRKYAIDVLIFVYNQPGEMQKTIIEEGGGGRVARRDRLSELVKEGLIRDDSSGNNWTAIRYYCTEEGSRIARGLKILESGEELMDESNYETSPEQMDSIN